MKCCCWLWLPAIAEKQSICWYLRATEPLLQLHLEKALSRSALLPVRRMLPLTERRTGGPRFLTCCHFLAAVRSLYIISGLNSCSSSALLCPAATESIPITPRPRCVIRRAVFSYNDSKSSARRQCGPAWRQNMIGFTDAPAVWFYGGFT